METAWRIRRKLGSDTRFTHFLYRHALLVVKPLEPVEALLMAQTWEVIQHHPQLREFLAWDPGELLALAKSAAAVEMDLRQLTDDQLTAVIARAPRLRKGALKKLKVSLIESNGDASGP